MKMDGKYVFCVGLGIYATSRSRYIPENYVNSKKDILSKIAYYGYADTSQTNYDYAITQIMIWAKLGDKFISSNTATDILL